MKQTRAWLVEVSADQATLDDIETELVGLLKEWGYSAWVTTLPEALVPPLVARKNVVK